VGAGVVQTVHVTIAVLGHAGDAHEQLVVDQRDVGCAARVHAVELAVGQRHGAAAVTGGLAREQLDRAADRIAPRQRALRSAQHLDALQVSQVDQRARQRGVVHVVDVQADSGLEREIEIRLAHAADEGDESGAVLLALRRQRHVRGLGSDFVDAGLAALLEHVTRHRGDRDGGVLQVLAAELRGDDHLTQRVVVGRFRPCGGLRGRKRQRDGRPDLRARDCVCCSHLPSPWVGFETAFSLPCRWPSSYWCSKGRAHSSAAALVVLG
jgi:hypothetical protein